MRSHIGWRGDETFFLKFLKVCNSPSDPTLGGKGTNKTLGGVLSRTVDCEIPHRVCGEKNKTSHLLMGPLCVRIRIPCVCVCKKNAGVSYEFATI